MCGPVAVVVEVAAQRLMSTREAGREASLGRQHPIRGSLPATGNLTAHAAVRRVPPHGGSMLGAPQRSLLACRSM